MNLDRKSAQELKAGAHCIQPGARIRRPSENGFTMMVAIFLLALFTLAMAVAAPEMAKQIQLDREHETMERGKQYVRAIQLYYRKFHAYPPSVDALVNTADIRFLRQKYTDPLTGKNDWRMIHFGQAKTQTLGFFGKPLMGAGMAGGSVLAGTGPSGGNMPVQNGGLGGAGSSIGGGMGPSLGGANGGIGSSFGGGSGGMGSAFGGGTGTSPGGSTGSPFNSSPFGSNDSGNTGTAPSGATGTNGTNGTTGTSGASGTGTSSADNGNGSGMGSGMGLGSGDQTFGGAGIIGVAPVSKKQSIMIYKKKDHYTDWEFVYDPLTDIQTMGGSSGPGGMPAGGNPNQNGGSPSPFGTSPGGNGIGGGGIGGPGSGLGGSPSGIGGGSGPGGIGGSGLGGGLGGSGLGGNGLGGNNPSPQPQPQGTPQQQ